MRTEPKPDKVVAVLIMVGAVVGVAFSIYLFVRLERALIAKDRAESLLLAVRPPPHQRIEATPSQLEVRPSLTKRLEELSRDT
jgi:hypothetical protein